jgi:hypothetical protein
MSQTRQEQPPTISREFAARLDRLGAKQKVRAMVMLRAGENGQAPPRRAARHERQQIVEKTRQAARAALPDIDRILKIYGGSRLSEDVDALGSLTVETTAEGVRALADSEHVKAILEDQPILRPPQPRR